YPYEMIELAPEKVGEFVKSGYLDGFNVTIPYKKDVIPFLDKVDERAQKIGAVNTLVKRDGKLLGFNTDFDGMRYMLSRAGIDLKDKNVLILGSGGTSNTSRAVAEFLGASSVKLLSRSGELNYDTYKTLARDSQVIINTTPVGMYPENYNCLIDLTAFPNLTGVADAVYNPATTMLLYQAKKLGVKYTNGFPMLVAQAKYAMELFLDQKVSDDVIEPIIKTLSAENQNIILVGMPGSGKTTVGKALAEKLNKEFIDTDQEIVNRENRSIPEIFETNGEEYFRKVESEVLKDVGKLAGKVISTGGGVIKNKENYFPLMQNGKIFWIDRKIESLVTDGRPLSKDLETVKKLYLERKDNYTFFADVIIKNDGTVDDAVKGVIDAL
ncbi:MAG: AAA family ATPase, partial [Clostridia bacterium]|nr:AAA family ATPase [Clostridia bacterium]